MLGSTVASSWLPRARRALLPLILLLSSTQLGYHFWPSSALVYGVRVDYLSPTVYFLDLLILAYLFLQKFRPPLILYSLLTILTFNLLFSINPLATFSWSLHLLLYSCFVLSLTTSTIRRSSIVIQNSFLVASLFQLILSVGQVYRGQSFQGSFYYLGERLVAVGQPGVALATFMDKVVLRAYGTFSHPNILAGWLVISLLIILKISRRVAVKKTILVITALGVLLTQSRSAALSLFAVIIPFYFLKTLRSRLIYFTVLLVLILGSSSFLLPARADLSVGERLSLQTLSLRAISHYPIVGTGADASISTYPALDPSHRLLQPDHNSFTLLLSWFGLAGILTIICLIRKYGFTVLRLYDVLPLIPLLLLDHYLLTSPQGLFILILYLRTSASRPEKKNSSLCIHS